MRAGRNGSRATCPLLSRPRTEDCVNLISVRRRRLAERAPVGQVVIQMEFSRCKVVAIGADDPRCRSLLMGVTIEMEDPRCKTLHASAGIEMEDRRCNPVGMELEDPRCKDLRLW
jgi:hypothetical protein